MNYKYFSKSVQAFGILILTVFPNANAVDVETGTTSEPPYITPSSKRVKHQDVACGIYQLNSSLSLKIQSPYLQNEDNSSSYECTLEFYGIDECNPTITCDTFDLLESTNCDTEFLELDDASGGRTKFCATNPPNAASSSSILIAYFKSDAQKVGQGFHCNVDCATTGGITSLDNLSSTRKNKPKETLPCGVSGSKNRGDRIVGGQDTKWEKFPWHLSLQLYGTNICGGSLIAPNKVLTAAHCTIEHTPSELSIRIGTSTLNKGGTVINVISKSEHPDYSQSKNYLNDVSVLILATPFNGTTICIPPSTTDLDKYAGQLGTLTGWGILGTGKEQPTQLQRLVLPLNKWAECKKAHGSNIHKSQTCFGAMEGGKAQCNSDSGSPLVVAGSDGKYSQDGIVSWSVKPCASKDSPGVFARVTDPRINAFIKSKLKNG